MADRLIRLMITSQLDARGITRAEVRVKGLSEAVSRATNRMLGLGAAFLAIREAGESVRVFAEFEDSLVRANAVFGTGAEGLEELRQRTLELGETTLFGARDISSAFFEMAKSGFTFTEAVTAMEPAINLATIAGTNLAESADLITDVMAAAQVGIEGLTGVADLLAKGTLASTSSLNELADALKFVSPLTTSMGIELDETTAALLSLSEAGFRGTIAGTALRRIIINIRSVTGTLREELIAAGVQVDEFALGQIGLEAVLKQLRDAIDDGNLSIQQQDQLFGKLAVSQAAFLLSNLDTEKGMGAFLETLQQASGESERLAGIFEETTSAEFKKFQNVMENVRIALGEQLAPTFLLFAETLQNNQGTIAKLIELLGRVLPLIDAFAPVLDTLLDSFAEVFDILVDLGVFDGLVVVITEVLGLLKDWNLLLPVTIGLLAAFLGPISLGILLIGLFGDEIGMIIGAVKTLGEMLKTVALRFVEVTGGILKTTVVGRNLMFFFTGLWNIVKFVAEGFVLLGGALEKFFVLSGGPAAQFLVDLIKSIGGVFGDLAGAGAGGRAIGFQRGNVQVQSPGLAMVHAGEVITNPMLGQQPPATAAVGAGGNTFNINITTTAPIDVRMLEREIRKMERRASRT